MLKIDDPIGGAIALEFTVFEIAQLETRYRILTEAGADSLLVAFATRDRVEALQPAAQLVLEQQVLIACAWHARRLRLPISVKLDRLAQQIREVINESSQENQDAN